MDAIPIDILTGSKDQPIILYVFLIFYIIVKMFYSYKSKSQEIKAIKEKDERNDHTEKFRTLIHSDILDIKNHTNVLLDNERGIINSSQAEICINWAFSNMKKAFILDVDKLIDRHQLKQHPIREGRLDDFSKDLKLKLKSRYDKSINRLNKFNYCNTTLASLIGNDINQQQPYHVRASRIVIEVISEGKVFKPKDFNGRLQTITDGHVSSLNTMIHDLK